jgi:tetratricopeptide (TPR) repeat protein
MVSLVLLVMMLVLLPFAIRAATRRRSASGGVRWHGIQWERPDEAEALLTKAIAKQRAGDLTGALADYDGALAVKRTATVLNNRGCALLEAGQIDRALADLREAVTIDPQSATAHCSLAEALARKSDHAAALESLERAVAIEPSWRQYAKTAEGFAGLRSSLEGKRWLGGVDEG